jgi:carbon storage regulator
MLILKRKRGEAIVMDGGVRIVVLDVGKRGATIGIEAPLETNIQREELLLRVAEENRLARASDAKQWAKALPVTGTPIGSTSMDR